MSANLTSVNTAVIEPKYEPAVDIESIAAVCHAAMAQLKLELGETPLLPAWDDAPQEVRDSTLASVRDTLANPNKTPEQEHRRWYEEKYAAGWRYGPIRTDAVKLHPCMLPYENLPVEQQAKDALMRSITLALGMPWLG